ncbi:MAG: T9SS type A sorting domain-containing protein [Bacteroidota bacterium]
MEDPLDGNQALFNLVVRAKSSADLKDLIRINSSITQAEAYNLDAEPMGLYLAIGEEALDTEASLLFQNYPNPFINETAIGFYLPEADAVTIQIHDVEGRIIKTIEGAYGAGYHSVPLNNNDLPSTGVYSYRLLTGDFEGSRQLILLD